MALLEYHRVALKSYQEVADLLEASERMDERKLLKAKEVVCIAVPLRMRTNCSVPVLWVIWMCYQPMNAIWIASWNVST